MPKKIIHRSGAVEFIDSEEEKEIKTKHHGKGKAGDFSQKELNELTLKIAKKLNLL